VPINKTLQYVSVSGYVEYGAIKYNRARSGFIAIECQSVLETVSGKHFPIGWMLIRCTTLQCTQIYFHIYWRGIPIDLSIDEGTRELRSVISRLVLIFTAADSDGNMMNWLTHEFPSGKRICIHVQVWPVPVPLTGFSLNLNRAPRIAQFRRTSVYTHTDRIGTDWIAAMTEMELIMVGRAVGWSGCRRRLGQS